MPHFHEKGPRLCELKKAEERQRIRDIVHENHHFTEFDTCFECPNDGRGGLQTTTHRHKHGKQESKGASSVVQAFRAAGTDVLKWHHAKKLRESDYWVNRFVKAAGAKTLFR